MSVSRGIFYWLYLCAFMVLAMAVIGAITRLTESGLSIVEWRPVTGWIPPLSEEEWLRQYELYKQSPEFVHKHHWMELRDFQKIFFWEWLHRLWGRLIGLVFILPLLWFRVRKQIPPGYGRMFVFLLALGGLQGFIGWWMVRSGLVDNPYVSPYRLAVHLGMALLIFGLIWWTILDLKPSGAWRRHSRNAKAHALISLLLLGFVIIWGAFVAGLDAGMIYNSFPLMNGAVTPLEPFSLTSPLADRGWVQFTHRWLAILTGTVILSLGWRLRDFYLMGVVLIQVFLGIATLLTQVWIPLAALHQAGAIILLALTISVLHRTFRDRRAQA